MYAIKGYMMAVDGRSYEAVSRVLSRIIRGEQKGFEAKFVPTSGQLGQWARDEDEFITRMRLSSSSKLVSYPMGGKVPEGYVSLSAPTKQSEEK